jgi:hypothetical protein
MVAMALNAAAPAQVLSLRASWPNDIFMAGNLRQPPASRHGVGI